MVWLGLLDKISKADLFVILDHVQYRKGYFQNRNKIRTKEGWVWLTIPIRKHSHDTKIKDIEIADFNEWGDKYLNLIKNHYIKSKYFSDYYPDIEAIIRKKHKYLSDLNIDIILFLLKNFNIENNKIVRSSDLDIPPTNNPSDVNLEICKKLKADIYLSGPSGKDYLNLEDFRKAGIKVVFHEFNHPTYSQVFEGFQPYMSAIDALFNLGPEARKLI